MFVQADLEDQYPGRCVCHKLNIYTGEMERCLGYQGEAHVCEWENRRPVTHWMSHSRYNRIKPEPWVRPGDEEKSIDEREDTAP